MAHSITIWTGPSAYTSNPITVTAALGGNTGTGRVIDLTIAPVAVAEAVRAYNGPGGQRGGVYVKALRDSIDDACGGCTHKVNGSCYVQHNVRSAGQPAKHLATAAPTVNGREGWQAILRMGKLSGFDYVRGAVAGSSGAIPSEVWAWIAGDVRAAGLKFLGYFEDWRSSGEHLKGLHMASVQSRASARKARALGWGVFASLPVQAFAGGYTLPEGATLCPKSAEAKKVHGLPVTCTACGLCDGGARTVFVVQHGPGDAARKRSRKFKGSPIFNHAGDLVGTI